jgi:hypothetical protein
LIPVPFLCKILLYRYHSTDQEGVKQMLKLIVSHSDSLPEAQSFFEEAFTPVPQEPFSCNIYPKGPSLYVMAVQDPSHYLKTELVLEIATPLPEGEPPVVICHFPEISGEALSAFIEEDETLYGIIMTQFQMKIMNELLHFSARNNASNLVLYSDDSSGNTFMVYRDFFISEDEEDPQEMIIPLNHELNAKWADYTAQIFLKFAQTLWQGQRWNPAIRHYLETHPFCKVD